MNEDESTKDMTDDLSDRQLLLDLRQSMGGLVARVGELEKRTNPLPPNFDARFAALERMLAEFKSEMKTELRLLREDIPAMNSAHAMSWKSA